MCFFIAQTFHDISPPVNYSLIPTWLVFVAAFVALALLGTIGWLVFRWSRRRPKPQQTPRDRALELLERARAEISQLNPYQFSIRVSDILRRYVTEQYQLPLTRQTSVEFLESLAKTSSFSEADTQLLGDFLNRCDLIKFARYEASTADSELLLEEATRFVKGAQLEPA
jgi:hypothetical protein